MDSSIDQVYWVKMENLRLIQVRTSDKGFRANDVLFEILNLGLLLVVNWKPGF